MSQLSSGNKALSGGRLYLAVALWVVLVVAGIILTVYGCSASPADDQPVAQTTPDEQPDGAAQGAVDSGDDSGGGGDDGGADMNAPTVPPASDDVFGYGIAVQAVSGAPADVIMNQVANQLGLGWVKQQMRWEEVEPNQGEYNWAQYDWMIEQANAQGLRVLLSIVAAPNWTNATPPPDGREAPPDDLQLYADFVGQVVDRYQGRIHAIEVWNEQNLDREWDTTEGVNAESYVEMLRLTYNAIQERDPSIVVISGAPSPTGLVCYGSWPECAPEGRPVVIDDFLYVEQMIAAGVLDYCDCMGAHHNGNNIPPYVATGDNYEDPDAIFRGFWDSPDNHEWSFYTTLWGYHERILEAGRQTPLCLTEFGWATAEGFDSYPAGFEFALDNTLEEQAEWEVQAFELMHDWGFVQMAFLWNLNYSQMGWGPEDPNAPYGIVDMSGAPRPAYGAIGAMDKPE